VPLLGVLLGTIFFFSFQAYSVHLKTIYSTEIISGQLCVWSIDTWEKRKSVPIQLPVGKAPVGETRVQFHSDQLRLLVSHETQLAIYDASKMERIRQVKLYFYLVLLMWLLVADKTKIDLSLYINCCSGFHKMFCLLLYHMQLILAIVS
jgi:hypothetical protein